MKQPPRLTVLHYVGYDEDAGGIVSVIRTLRSIERFDCVIGVNCGFVQRREPPLNVLEFPRIEGEVISGRNWWRARRVARQVRSWLHQDPQRVFHGHSRAGLLVALWLRVFAVRRFVVTVHCYGSRKWFYRLAARVLGNRLFWLSPAMKRYYGVSGEDWSQCLPECVSGGARKKHERIEPGARVLRLGGIGSLVAWKNWHLVLDAIERLPKPLRAKVRFRHIGTSAASQESKDYADALRARVATSFSDVVELLGEHRSSAEFLTSVDCVVVASTNEPFSLAMLEALHARVPVLAANSGGAVDIVRPPEHGWLFRSGDAQDLARAICDLLEGGKVRSATFGAKVLARFSALHAADEYSLVYGAVVA